VVADDGNEEVPAYPLDAGDTTWPELRLQQVGVRSDGGQAVVE
jgi:hypothetical protein